MKIYLLVYSDALILMSLCGNHNIRFIKNKHGNFTQIKNTILDTPV